jgi:hypothetical protein
MSLCPEGFILKSGGYRVSFANMEEAFNKRSPGLPWFNLFLPKLFENPAGSVIRMSNAQIPPKPTALRPEALETEHSGIRHTRGDVGMSLTTCDYFGNYVIQLTWGDLWPIGSGQS